MSVVLSYRLSPDAVDALEEYLTYGSRDFWKRFHGRPGRFNGAGRRPRWLSFLFSIQLPQQLGDLALLLQACRERESIEPCRAPNVAESLLEAALGSHYVVRRIRQSLAHLENRLWEDLGYLPLERRVTEAEQGLRQALAEEPGDLELWKVYRDWLDEHGWDAEVAYLDAWMGKSPCLVKVFRALRERRSDVRRL